MAERCQRSGAKCDPVVARYSAPEEVWGYGDSFVGTDKTSEDLLLAGSGYAWREVNEMHVSLVAGRLRGSSNSKLEIYGAVSKASSLIGLRANDSVSPTKLPIDQFVAGYVPYWRDSKMVPFARSAFPSKLSLYLALGLPVLYHGPYEGSPSAYIKDHGLGSSIRRVSPRAATRVLRMLSSTDFVAEFHEARELLRSSAIGPGGLGRVFAQQIG